MAHEETTGNGEDGRTNGLMEEEERSLHELVEASYRDYAMYVIQDRALPALADGLKPVQRRILHAMNELGLARGAKHKKAARTVGDVMGKYHPHGDSACYEAMVLMAQGFATRHPLVEGQGNWGSADDPKSFAAMRYTEARLAPYADSLLAELGRGTVDWQQNFDGTLREPCALPAQLPNVVLNGATGIAVGMTTEIPAHNAHEVARACRDILAGGDAGQAVQKHIPGPDFAAGGRCTSTPEEIAEAYRTGRGTLRVRAQWSAADGEVVVTSIPPQTAGGRILEQIGKGMESKALPWIEEVRDESDEAQPVRMVLALKRGADAARVMEHLCATTPLERTVRVELTVLDTEGVPRRLGLAALLEQWVAHRVRTVRRRTAHRLDEVRTRLEVLRGYLLAIGALDEVIRIIRREDEPAAAMQATLGMTERQAKAVLRLALGQIGRLEEEKVRKEAGALEAEEAELARLLEERKELEKLVSKEIGEAAERYGDARRTELAPAAAGAAMGEEEVAVREPVTVVVSREGWIRVAKGHDVDAAQLGYRSGDQALGAARAMGTDTWCVLGENGRAYSGTMGGLPSARGLGEPLAGRFDLVGGGGFAGVVAGADADEVLVASDRGYGFVATVGQLRTHKRTGKACLTLGEGWRPVEPRRIAAGDTHVLACTSAGRALLVPLAEVPRLPKGKGNKIIDLPPKAQASGERMVAATPWQEGQEVEVAGERGTARWAPGDVAGLAGRRGQRGGLGPKARVTGRIVGMARTG